MSTEISPLSYIAPGAQLGTNVRIGPFCCIGPQAIIGDGSVLDCHVSILGKVTIGRDNRFSPNVVIGGEPQDKGFRDDQPNLAVEIGDNNQFREGVTVNRGAAKEDGITRIGHRNLLMSNSHVAHNCQVHNDTILVNGVLLGGHVHIHDKVIISGNSVVHHYSTVGTLAFIAGGCRAPHDVAPYMLAAGSDNPEIKTVNLVGLKRAGVSESSIEVIKKAFRLIYRDHMPLAQIREFFSAQLNGVFPIELVTLLNFIEQQRKGRMGRGREPLRHAPKGAEAEVSETEAA